MNQTNNIVFFFLLLYDVDAGKCWPQKWIVLIHLKKPLNLFENKECLLVQCIGQKMHFIQLRSPQFNFQVFFRILLSHSVAIWNVLIFCNEIIFFFVFENGLWLNSTELYHIFSRSMNKKFLISIFFFLFVAKICSTHHNHHNVHSGDGLSLCVVFFCF